MSSATTLIRRAFRHLGRAVREAERGTGRTQRRATPTAHQLARGVVVEYTPQLDGDPDPGEVVWTWVPFEDDPSRGKDRPVVIIGRSPDGLVGVPLTSKRSQRGDVVPVGSGAWDSRRRPSFAKVDRLLAVDPGDVRREGAVLARDRFGTVVAGASRFHDLRPA